MKNDVTGKNKRSTKSMAWVLAFCMLISIITMALPYQPQEVKAAESTFVHPGILHTQQSIDAMRNNIANKAEPTLTAYNYLLSDGYSAPDWAGRPLENVVRGGSGDNRAQLYIDIERAYHTALLWKLGAGEEYGDAAVRILNGWSSTMKSLTGNADRFLAAGIYGYQMANAAELVRDHKDFDKAAMDELLLNIFYPMNQQFLTNHNDASISNYWANWDLCNIASMIAIGVFTDREDIYNEAVEYYKNGIGMGSVFNTMPYVYEEGLVQWQEAGRDQGHATLGIGLCGAINEIAWSQGDDLYGMSDNRFLKAAEYVAKYNNTADADADNVPYSAYTRHNSANNKYETYSVVSNAGRPALRPVYTAIYNHYVNRMGLEAPEIKKVLYADGATPYIEGGQRNGDEPGWQSLTFHNVSTRTEGENAERKQGSLADGIYRFTNNKSGKVLVDNQGTLQQTEMDSMDSEWWKVESVNNGEYTITNVATGRVIQIDAYEYISGSAAYTAGTKFVLGDAKTGEMNQRLAILKKGSNNIYRIASAISSHVLELANANIADDATICQWRYEGGSHQEWISEKKNEKEKIADFSFENEKDGLAGANAIAVPNGNVTFADDEERGTVLSLSGDAWLDVTKTNGGALLNGCEELTVSYYSKVANAGTAWGFYAAADTSTQIYKKEKYMGIFEKDNQLTAERYHNGRQKTAVAGYENGWNYIAAVFAKDSIKVYINGILAATADNTESMTSILGENSILQIGKANWGNGEFYEGLLDDFSIYNYAMSETEIFAISNQ